MKTIITLLVAFAALNILQGQSAELDINDVSATVNATGVLFEKKDIVSNTILPGFITPRGTGKATIFSSGLWITGLDINNQIRGGFTRYSTDNSFSPGPLSGLTQGGTSQVRPYGNPYVSQGNSQQWNIVFKIKKTEIDSFRQYFACQQDPSCNESILFPSYVVPSVIADWYQIAHGDIALQQDQFLAPFIDVNNDGLYDHLDGDYPCIKGDEYAFFIFNDLDSNSSQSGVDRMGVEIHAEVYSFDTISTHSLAKTVFVSMDVINRSSETFTDVYLSSYNDFDIGCAQDDFIGTFSTLNAFYGYNGDAIDNYCSITSKAYDSITPAQGVVFLNNQLSKTFAGGGVNTGNFLEYRLAQQAIFPDGSPLVYGGNGYPGSTGSSNITTDFHYPYIQDTSVGVWNQYDDNSIPSDRKMLGSVKFSSFSPGETISFDLAYVFSQSDTAMDNLASVRKLRKDIPIIQNFYDQYIQDCPSGYITNLGEFKQEVNLNIFPNPSSSEIYLSFDESVTGKVEIVDMKGTQLITTTIEGRVKQIDARSLKEGLYIVRFFNENQSVLSHKFVKLNK